MKRDIYALITGFFISFAIVFSMASCAAARPEVKSDFQKRQAIGLRTMRPAGGVAVMRRGEQTETHRAPANNNITATLVTKGSTLSISFDVLAAQPGQKGTSVPAVQLTEIAPGVYSQYLNDGDGMIVETWITTPSGATRLIQGSVGDAGFAVDEAWVSVTRTAGK